MKFYLVGGAVRDHLLGIPNKDKDWVVVGATPEQLTVRGFQAVGSDFPVFLHPSTKEEYALARTERKRGRGYHGFTTQHSANVTLEQDLLRRDLSINAMAMDEEGKIIDPYQGQRDLQLKILRHISPAFREDPLRVLRVARFAARYYHLGFRIAPETIAMMRYLSISDEIMHLSAERIWQETRSALMEPSPSVFFDALQQTGALKQLFPELDQLIGVPQTPQYHPEVDTWLHTKLALNQAANYQYSSEVRFAVLLHDLGKGLTPSSQWPRHRQHEIIGVEAVESLCQRLKCPKRYKDLALLVSKYHLLIHQANQLKPKTILKLLTQTDAFRRPERFTQILNACLCDSQGKKGCSTKPYHSLDFLQNILSKTKALNIKELLSKESKTDNIAERIERERLSLIKNCIKDYRFSS